MTTSTKTANPLRPKALGYLRDGRVLVLAAVRNGAENDPPVRVLATIDPAPDTGGQSVRTTVRYVGGIWDCDEHPGANSCAHRLAVQMVTGHGRLGGGWQA